MTKQMKLEFEEMGNGYLVTISHEKQKTSSEDDEKIVFKGSPKTGGYVGK